MRTDKKKVWLFIILIGSLVILSGVTGCDKQPSGEPDFNLIFKYGIGAKNILDTFEGTCTKDMVADPSISTELTLTDEEKDSVYQKMLEIDFFNYPDNFSVSVPPGEPVGIVTPYASYYFKVEYNSQAKELHWGDEITNPDEKAGRLRELIALIRSIVESKEEYKKLPEPTTAYQ